MEKYNKLFVPKATVTREELLEATRLNAGLDGCALETINNMIDAEIDAEPCAVIECRTCIYHASNCATLLEYLNETKPHNIMKKQEETVNRLKANTQVFQALSPEDQNTLRQIRAANPKYIRGLGYNGWLQLTNNGTFSRYKAYALCEEVTLDHVRTLFDAGPSYEVVEVDLKTFNPLKEPRFAGFKLECGTIAPYSNVVYKHKTKGDIKHYLSPYLELDEYEILRTNKVVLINK